MKPLKLVYLAIAMISAACSFAQKNSFKFETLLATDFSSKVYSIDSNATAVILADVGSTSFVGNKKGWFTMIFKRHERIRILKSPAMDLATVKIVLYRKDDDEESLEDVKATTYNEINGSVTATVLDRHDIFEEKLDKNHTEKKFTMPAVKEGSIIDIQYTIKSDFTFNLQPWTFQHVNYPCLWSEYEVAIPGLLNYIFLKKGFNEFFIDKKDQKSQNYRVTIPRNHDILGAPDEDLNVSTTDSRCRWVMKDLPGFNDVDHVSSPDNYLDKMEFQLSQVSYDGQTVKDVMNTWPKVTEDLMNRDDFAGALKADNFWLDNDLEAVTGNSTDKLEIANKIYDYVKYNYTCSGNWWLIKRKLSDVFKAKKGNAGELNLILIAMLRKKGITADPVLLSTRDNGKPYDQYPMIAKYNFAFCRAIINNKTYYLDASHPFLGFGKLDPQCYNGPARVINTAAERVDLFADSLKEFNSTLVNVAQDNDGNLVGAVYKMTGYYESYHLREQIAKTGKDNYYAELQKTFPEEWQIKNLQFDSLKMLNEPLQIHYDFLAKTHNEKLIYLNPFFGDAYEKNFFKSEERALPVEMDFPTSRVHTLTFEIPKGYIVDELPKPVKVKLNDAGDGLFEYLIQNVNGLISMRAKLIIKRTFFAPSEYYLLREFFDLVMKKQNENIVLKRID